MTPEQVGAKVAARLYVAEVPFLFVGSFSSNHHGIPRSTKDVDIVVQTPAGRIRDLGAVLGDDFVPVDQFRFETNTGTVCQEFTVRDGEVRVELFTLSEDEHDQARFARRKEGQFLGQTAFFPTPEDVIVWKLRWARPKDLEDVKGVILVQEAERGLDWRYVRDWCAKHGTTKRLEAIIASLPKRSQ